MARLATVPERPYDLIVYGATGYLGSLIARHLTDHAPTSLNWAIAGRTQAKLDQLRNKLKMRAGSQDRKSPGTIEAALDDVSLRAMASQSRVLLNTVGPFCIYGTRVVEACIDSSTMYIDTTGEHVWMHEIASQLHEKALAKGVIIIPQCAVESAAPDILTYTLANFIANRDPTHPTDTGPVQFSIRHGWPGIGSGPVMSGLASLSHYSLAQINRASAPLACTIPDAGPHHPYPAVSLLPVRSTPFLNALTFNPSALADRAVVMRTWSLLQRHGSAHERYGPRFSFTGYTGTSSVWQGWLQLAGLSVAMALIILLPPLRWLLQYVAPSLLGPGPTVPEDQDWHVEWRARADPVSDRDNRSPQSSPAKAPATAGAIMRVNVDVFTACAILASEAAVTMLHLLDLDSSPRPEEKPLIDIIDPDSASTAHVKSKSKSDSLAARIGGGVLTPASLGEAYLDRLKQAGFAVRVGWLEN